MVIKADERGWNEYGEFKKFKNDQTFIEKAKNTKLKGTLVLMELFVLYRKRNLMLPGEDPSKLGQQEAIWWPVAKIINGGKTEYTPGTIVKLPNEIANLRKNPEYLGVLEYNKENPGKPLTPPSEYIGDNIKVWFEKYRYRFNPIDNTEDTNIILAPSLHIEAEIDVTHIPDK